MTYLLLVLGFVALIKGADYFVEGASGIAKIFKIPPILIGLTIVAFGTSAPEAAVSIKAAIDGNNGIALGNVVGSNILNISLIVGITSFIFPLKVERQTVIKEIPFTLLASIALFILIIDIKLQGSSSNVLSRGDGLILLCFFSIFLYYLFEVAINSREKISREDTVISMKTGRCAIFAIGGLIGIILGGNLVVKSSTTIAYSLGMSETLVGLTIVALGTSLPELITCVTAALKKHSDIAVGNIVGSNIFNILFVLGSSSIISPLPVESKIYADMSFMLIYTFVLFIFSRTHHKISRLEGAILILSYIVYTVYIIIRN